MTPHITETTERALANGKGRLSQELNGSGDSHRHGATTSPPPHVAAQQPKRRPPHGRVAVVHDWLDSYAGAELVVEHLLDLFDEADIFTLVDFLPPNDRHILNGNKVFTSFLQRLPLARKKFRGYLPLMPLAVEQFDLSGYDVVVSSNHAVCKGVLTREDQLHLCYMHTPVRYAWDLYHETLRINKLTRGVKSIVTRLILHYLRMWDFATASRVDAFAANSHYVARRIWKTYRRKARVIYPPVSIERFQMQRAKEDFYVTLSRLVPYKRVDLIVDAFARMPGKRLVVIGDGPERSKLESRATPNVTFLGRAPAEQVNEHLQAAKAFVFAADEDFGISPIEAQACGTPVIAYGHGGATETVVENQTGLFFEQQTAESLMSAIEAFEEYQGRFQPEEIRAHAEQFAPERFRARFDAFIGYHLEKRRARQRAAV
jgi:glycosyltransferase involved in cell wall biosynthesis